MSGCEEDFEKYHVPEPTAETVETMLDSFGVRLWYRDEKREREWWCSRCCGHGKIRRDGMQATVTGAEWMLAASKHKDFSKCPACDRIGELTNVRLVKNPKRYFRQHAFMVITPVSHDEVWIVEKFATYRPYVFKGYYADDEVDPSARVTFRDVVRFRLEPGEVRQWACRWGGTIWYAESKICDAGRFHYPLPEASFSRANGTQIITESPLSETFLKYNSWAHYGSKYSTHYGCYLAHYALHPSIEMMVKAGYSDIVYDLVVNGKDNRSVVKWDETDPRRAFGLSKELLTKLKGYDSQVQMLQNYHRYRKRGERDPWHCAELISRFRPSYGVKYAILNRIKPSGTTEIELYRYFEKLLEENPGCGMNRPPEVDRTWKDYIEAAARIGYDLTQKAVVMPKDVWAKHDEAVALRNEMFPRYNYGTTAVTPDIVKKFEERASALVRKYGVIGAEYFIRVPKHPNEIITEGQTLEHCVGGYNYINNHAQGRNPILFLRRVSEPDVPFYTLEIDVKTNKILQCEGCKSKDGSGRYGHIHRKDLPDEAQAFLDAWESARIIEDTKKKKETKTA